MIIITFHFLDNKTYMASLLLFHNIDSVKIDTVKREKPCIL